ncbi:MAG TPA: GAF domain-containing protein [Thermoanaerobaculia bacterium]|nr:GAF domain-containing protein [Thermoanaerobaculia bacterium]
MHGDVSDKAKRLLESFASGKELVEQLIDERQHLARRVDDLQQENHNFASRYLEMETQSSNLANLYVVSHQLHSTLDFREVVQIVREVVINFIGSECFAILLMNEETNELVTIASEGGDLLPEIQSLTVRVGDGKLGAAARNGESDFLREKAFDRNPSVDRPLAIVPLKIKDRTIGLLVVYQLLEQKRAFSETDFQLFSLLAGQAATAIFSAKLYTEAERKLNTIQEFLELLTTEA